MKSILYPSSFFLLSLTSFFGALRNYRNSFNRAALFGHMMCGLALLLFRLLCCVLCVADFAIDLLVMCGPGL